MWLTVYTPHLLTLCCGWEMFDMGVGTVCGFGIYCPCQAGYGTFEWQLKTVDLQKEVDGWCNHLPGKKHLFMCTKCHQALDGSISETCCWWSWCWFLLPLVTFVSGHQNDCEWALGDLQGCHSKMSPSLASTRTRSSIARLSSTLRLREAFWYGKAFQHNDRDKFMSNSLWSSCCVMSSASVSLL